MSALLVAASVCGPGSGIPAEPRTGRQHPSSPPIRRRTFFRVEAIDDDGTVTLRREGLKRILTIGQGMKRRTWWLPDRFGAYKAMAEAAEQ